jgi:glycosyltransferase involved in cell wall biosynthesis
MKVTHIITGLDAGGAETMLHKLLSRLIMAGVCNEVICLTSGGPMEDKIRALGVPVKALGMGRGRLGLIRFAELVRRLRKSRPDLVQTWMYHADLVGGVAARLAGCRSIVWNIRHSNLDSKLNRRHTLWAARLCSVLSKSIPTRIICNSEGSARIHAEFGYAGDRMIVIPNGFDLKYFRPMPEVRAEVRMEFGLPEHALLVGLIARYHPQKDHGNFLQAAAKVVSVNTGVAFLLVGKDVEPGNVEIETLLDRYSLRDRVHLLGHREDIPRLTAALDVACSSSLGEGFPNAIGEALAAGIPCVVTDVGDSGFLVGAAGMVVPSGNSVALAGALLSILGMDYETRRSLGNAGRERVMSKFNLQAVTDEYLNLYHSVTRIKSN